MAIFTSITRSVQPKLAALLLKAPFLKRKLFYIPALLIILAVGGYAAFAKPSLPQFETATVEREDIVQTVSQSGTVEAAEEADLSFTASGRIQTVSVHEGQHVTRGQLLGTLESTAEYASLLSAQARLRQQQASYQSAGTSLELTKAQQNQLVETAKHDLITDDLKAYVIKGAVENDNSLSYDAPQITGSYTCEKQGVYRLELYHSASASGGSFKYHGIEEGIATISTLRPVPLGRCGLYIQFPNDFSPITTWEIPIPNTRSVTYQSRLDAYNAAVQSRNRITEEVHTAPILAAQIEEARAAVLGAQAALAQTRLVAPFSGTVTRVDAVRGAIAMPGTPAVSLISDSAFELTLQVAEDDIGELTIGDTAEVTFDAYDSAPVAAAVSFIAPAATTESGAAMFKVTLQFEEKDERIRAGLTADADIKTAERKHALAVPVRAVVEEDGHRFVRVLVADTAYREVPVTTGLSGDGRIEITSGLSEGDRIITFANDVALSALTKQ